MKTINKSIISAILFLAIVLMPTMAKAQITDKGYVDIDWQFNVPKNRICR